MCKIGDILLVYNAKNKKPIGMHPFIVLDDEAGVVRGVYAYDFIGLLLTSANTPEKRERLSKYDGNFPIAQDDKSINSDKLSDNRFAYAEADQFFYFDKNRIKYIQIGNLSEDIYDLIVEFIEELNAKGVEFKQILDKARKIE